MVCKWIGTDTKTDLCISEFILFPSKNYVLHLHTSMLCYRIPYFHSHFVIFILTDIKETQAHDLYKGTKNLHKYKHLFLSVYMSAFTK